LTITRVASRAEPRFAGVGEWVTLFDEDSGWVRVARRTDTASGREISIATGMAIGVTGGRLDSIWLQSIFE